MWGGGLGGGEGAGAGARGMSGGNVFSLGSSFFFYFFRQKAAIVFHSLKARVFLCGVVLVCALASSFHLPFHLLFRCVLEKFDLFLVDFLDPHLANVYILKNLIGSRTNLKGLIYLILIKFICETISFLFMNITINRYINVRPRTEPVRSVSDERL